MSSSSAKSGTAHTMKYAIQFAETGHLVLALCTRNSANQALDRVINFFPTSGVSSS